MGVVVGEALCGSERGKGLCSKTIVFITVFRFAIGVIGMIRWSQNTNVILASCAIDYVVCCWQLRNRDNVEWMPTIKFSCMHEGPLRILVVRANSRQDFPVPMVYRAYVILVE